MSKIDLRKLNDQELLASFERAVNEESSQTTFVLRHLIELEERRLHAVNHPSLFAFLTLGYRYSEGAAQRRIDAARMLREFPHLETKIQTMALSLTNLSQARSFFRKERSRGKPLASARKLEILTALEGKTAREAQVYLFSQSSDPHAAKKAKTSVRSIGDGLTSFRIIAPEELTADLRLIRDLWAHAVPDGNWVEIFTRMAKLTLHHIDPLQKAERAMARKQKAESKTKAKNASAHQVGSCAPRTQAAHSPTAGAGGDRNKIAVGEFDIDSDSGEVQTCFPIAAHASDKNRSSSPAKEQSDLASSPSLIDDCHRTTANHPACTTSTLRSQGTCTRQTQKPSARHSDKPAAPHAYQGAAPHAYQGAATRSDRPAPSRPYQPAAVRHAITLRDQEGCTHLDEDGKRCGSRWGLENDHIVPFALGGPDTIENLQRLCREHNAYRAQRFFGRTKIRARRPAQERTPARSD